MGGGGLPVIKYLASILLRNTCQDTSPTDDVEGTDHRAQIRTDLCTGTIQSRNYLDMFFRIFSWVETNLFYNTIIRMK